MACEIAGCTIVRRFISSMCSCDIETPQMKRLALTEDIVANILSFIPKKPWSRKLAQTSLKLYLVLEAEYSALERVAAVQVDAWGLTCESSERCAPKGLVCSLCQKGHAAQEEESEVWFVNRYTMNICSSIPWQEDTIQWIGAKMFRDDKIVCSDCSLYIHTSEC